MYSGTSITPLVALFAFALATVPLNAQEAEPEATPAHSGGWFVLGIGAGSGSTTCTGNPNCGTSESLMVPSGHLGFGGTVTPNLLLGVGTYGWVNIVESGVTTESEIIGFITVEAYFYPSPAIDFYLHGAAGVSGYTFNVSETTLAESLGPGFVVGAGLELGLVGVYANYMIGGSQTVKFLGVETDPKIEQTLKVLQFGVSFASR